MLAQFNLEGISAGAARAFRRFEVSFDIDADGILNVSAKDLGTGTEQKVKIEQSAGLSDQDIDKMQKEAEAHAEEDKQKRALAEARKPGRLDVLPDGKAR